MVWPNHKPLQLLRMRACFKDFPKLFSMRLKSRLFFYLHNTVEDVSYGCHKISVQSFYPIHIHTPQFLSPYSVRSSTHIIFVQGGCVLISIAPQSSSHLSARDMEPMAVTYEAAAPTPLPLSKCTYFGKKKYLYSHTYADK